MQSDPIEKTLWLKSQKTNAIARTWPAKSPCQNQLANFAPASIAKPTSTGAKNAASPISGFGNPKRAACSESITDLQLINGDMSQAVAAPGSPATLMRSRVRPKLAIQPIAPKPMRKKGNSMLGLSHFYNVHGILQGRCEHTRIEGFSPQVAGDTEN